MRISTLHIIIFCGMLLISACTCNQPKPAAVTEKKPPIIKGLYSFGPELKTFQECGKNKEFWVTDSSAQLELQYSQLNFEKPYLPVYIEVEGIKKPSGDESPGVEYDSILVVYKLLKITRQIPVDSCR